MGTAGTLIVAAAIWAGASAVFAQTAYPTKPVRWIVPYAAGGGTDTLVRAVTAKLTEVWEQQIIVDNRPGGGTNIGAELAAKSPPDGYTLFAPGVANAINMTLFPGLKYDIVRDFSHVTTLAKIPNVIAVHSSVPAKDVRELVALAKARPDALRHGSPGIGSPQHLGAELFKSIAGVRMVHIPYKGAAPALVDLIGGHIEVYFGAVISTLPHLQSGRARPLGVTSLERVQALAQVPTLDEQGFKGFEIASWVLLSVPSGTRRDIVATLHRDITRVLAAPEFRERMRAQGTQVIADSTQQVTAHVKAEVEKWGKAVKASGAKPEG